MFYKKKRACDDVVCLLQKNLAEAAAADAESAPEDDSSSADSGSEDGAASQHLLWSGAAIQDLLEQGVHLKCDLCGLWHCIAVGVVILLILRSQRACIRSKDWRCRARVTPARSP